MTEAKFKIGDLVRHKTGRRVMIITSVGRSNFDVIYDCKWEIKDDFNCGAFYEIELDSIKISKEK